MFVLRPRLQMSLVSFTRLAFTTSKNPSLPEAFDPKKSKYAPIRKKPESQKKPEEPREITGQIPSYL